MKSIFGLLSKYSFLIGPLIGVLSMAFLWWASAYFVTKEEYQKSLESDVKQSEVTKSDFKEINLKLDVILEGQRTQQAQFAAQNILNEQFKEQYKDLHERLKYMERKHERVE